jgi:hypothetical protein
MNHIQALVTKDFCLQSIVDNLQKENIKVIAAGIHNNHIHLLLLGTRKPGRHGCDNLRRALPGKWSNTPIMSRNHANNVREYILRRHREHKLERRMGRTTGSPLRAKAKKNQDDSRTSPNKNTTTLTISSQQQCEINPRLEQHTIERQNGIYDNQQSTNNIEQYHRTNTTRQPPTPPNSPVHGFTPNHQMYYQSRIIHTKNPPHSVSLTRMAQNQNPLLRQNHNRNTQ